MGEEEAGRIRVRKSPEERGLNSHRRLPLLQTSVMPGQVLGKGEILQRGLKSASRSADSRRRGKW